MNQFVERNFLKKKSTLNFRIYRVLSSESNASSLRRKNRRSRRVIRIGWGEDCPLLFVCTINYSLFHYPYSSVTRKVWTKRERERERGRKKIIKQILLLFLQSIHVFHSNKLVRFVRATYKGSRNVSKNASIPSWWNSEVVVGINVDETGSGTRVHLLSVKALYSSLSSIYIYIWSKRCTQGVWRVKRGKWWNTGSVEW